MGIKCGMMVSDRRLLLLLLRLRRRPSFVSVILLFSSSGGSTLILAAGRLGCVARLVDRLVRQVRSRVTPVRRAALKLRPPILMRCGCGRRALACLLVAPRRPSSACPSSTGSGQSAAPPRVGPESGVGVPSTLQGRPPAPLAANICCPRRLVGSEFEPESRAASRRVGVRK